MKINFSPFLQGILGGIVGVFIIFLLFFGFFQIMDRIHTVSLACEEEKIISSRSIECQILEIKDLGNALLVEDIVSPPPEEYERTFLKDEKTSGKFIQVKYKIKNERKEQINVSLTTLLDKTNRKYQPGWQLRYWIPKESQNPNIPSGFEKEIIEIFEVPKESQKPFKIKVKIFLSRFLD